MIEILVVNCNTSTEMTATIGAAAQAAAAPDARVSATNPRWGPPSADGFYDSFRTAAAVLETLTELDGSYDGVVLAGFGEHGREGARQLLDVPVVDITEAAAIAACLVGHRFGVVTTGRTAVGQIQDSLHTFGLAHRCVSVRATGIAVLDLDDAVEHTVQAFAEVGRRVIEEGADTIVLGCAGLSRFREVLSARLEVPVVDGVTAAVAMCEGLVRIGLRTSKAGAFAAPDLSRAGLRHPAPAVPAGQRLVSGQQPTN